MIFDFIFISKLPQRSSSQLEKGPEREGNFISCYIIEDIDKLFFDFFYNPIVFQNTKPFCLALRQEIFEKKKNDTTRFFSESFGSVFFNSSYFTLNGYPLVTVLSSSNEGGQESSHKKVLNVMEDIFKYLGYD